MNLKPLGNRIIIKPDAEFGSTKLALPDRVREKMTNRGVVVAVGEGERDVMGNFHPTKIKVGEHVMFGKLHAYPFDHEGEKYTMVEERELLCVIGA